MSFKLPESVPMAQAGLLETLGTGLGSGIGQGIKSVLENRLKQQLNLEELKNKTAMEIYKAPILAQAKEGAKMQAKEATAEYGRERFRNIVDEMEKMVPYTGTTDLPGTKSFLATKYGPNRKGLEMRNQFDTLSISIEGLFRDMTAKGNMPKAIFNALLERLPNSKLSERENLGRIAAIKKILTNPSKATSVLGIEPLAQEEQQGSTGTQTFNVNGKIYNIPIDQVGEFKKDMGL